MIQFNKFVFAEQINEDFKRSALDSESVLIPICLEPNSCPDQEVRQAFLVHLQIRKMAVTVYTSEQFAAEETQPPIADDFNKISEKDGDAESCNSDELGEDCDEFNVAPTTISTVQEGNGASNIHDKRRFSNKLAQIGPVTTEDADGTFGEATENSVIEEQEQS